MEIKLYRDTEWESFKRLRLEALATDPEAFGASLASEISRSDQEWKDGLTSPTKRIFGAFSDTDAVGILGLRYNTGEKLNHIAEVYSVYVQPAMRGQGIGKQLLAAAIDEAKRNNMRKMQLHVTIGQAAATKLYENAGFVIVGVLKDELNQGNHFTDTALMELYLIK